MDRPDFTINMDQFRVGQRGAFQVIYDRTRSRENFTTCVLPTRYGKTDVARTSALALWRDGFISNALIISPNKVLRDQAIDGEKYRDCLIRYGIPLSGIPDPFTAEHRRHLSRLDNARPFFICSLTTGMATSNQDILVGWVERSKRTKGTPPIVFIDEAHTSSDTNVWGELPRVLADAGAFIVLLTATPYRTDGQRIPGFEVLEESVTPVRITRRSGESATVNLYDANRKLYRLKAHWETTFRDAWDLEDPPPLCKVTCQPFEIPLSKMTSQVQMDGEARLSELGEREARDVLRYGLRDPAVIEGACRLLVNELRTKRRNVKFSNTAGIVFVGNDLPFDDASNRHAEDVKAMLKSLAPELHCVVATSATEGADEIIADFAKGVGDILVVKQMGGVGLDVERLKVCLDLSSVRAPASFVQRMTRICTVWKMGDGPEDVSRTGVYIVPDDCLAKALFQQLVVAEGGGFLSSVIEDFSLVGEVEPSNQERPPNPAYAPLGIAVPDMLVDTQRKEVSGDMLNPVDSLTEMLPGLGLHHTKPEIGQALITLGFKNSETPRDGNEIEEAKPILNQTKVHNQKKSQVNGVAKQIAAKRFSERTGRQYRGGKDQKAYGEIMKEIYSWHLKKIGIAHPRSLDDLIVEQLEGIHRNMTWELQRG